MKSSFYRMQDHQRKDVASSKTGEVPKDSGKGHERNQSRVADHFKAHQNKSTGWASMPSTSVFRAVNFELFVKPNKFVMACGVVAFTSCISYIVYMNLTDDQRKSTYVTLDEDGGLTTRPKPSRWS